MYTRNVARCLVCVEELCAAVVSLLCISEPLLDLLLARSQMRVHEHEASVVEVESNSDSTLICRHSFRSCLDLDSLLGSET